MVVVGGGIAGIACARALADAGVVVRVLDRGRRLGGRMAVRTEQLPSGAHPVDVGASYFTVRDDRFAAVVDRWQELGLARPWTDTFDLLHANGAGGAGGITAATTTGTMRWAATGGLRSLVENLAEGLEVTSAVEVGEINLEDSDPAAGSRGATGGPPALGRITVDGAPAAAVVLAMPEPQATDLLPPWLASALHLDRGLQWSPSIALWAAWQERWWGELDGAFVDGSSVLSWVADDGRRRADGAPVLVAHATAPFAAGHLDDPGSAAQPMLTELVSLLAARSAAMSLAPVEAWGVPAIPEPSWVRVHRWSLAAPGHTHARPFGLHPSLIGVCGDAWGNRPRIEQAWLSGHLLGGELAARLAAAS